MRRLWLGLVLAAVVVLPLLQAPVAWAQEGGRKIKSRAPAVYPELAKKMNLSGIVRVEVVVTPAGTVKNAKVVGGHPVLAEAAMEAAKKYKYEPGPNETTEVIQFNFERQ